MTKKHRLPATDPEHRWIDAIPAINTVHITPNDLKLLYTKDLPHFDGHFEVASFPDPEAGRIVRISSPQTLREGDYELLTHMSQAGFSTYFEALVRWAWTLGFYYLYFPGGGTGDVYEELSQFPDWS